MWDIPKLKQQIDVVLPDNLSLTYVRFSRPHAK